MGLTIGIVGLPNVGKSTIFNALTAAGVEAANYPFCTIEPNIGVVELPDERLNTLAEIIKPERVLRAPVKFVDIAGLVAGASKGEGLGNQFLANIREVDAIAHVVRCFPDDDVSHVSGQVDPNKDIETVNVELMLSDLQTVERRLERSKRVAKSGDSKAKDEIALLARLQSLLESGHPARLVECGEDDHALLKSFHLLTSKPVMYVANVGEEDIAAVLKDPAINPWVDQVIGIAGDEGAEVVIVSAKIEAELSELTADEKEIFLEELGLTESGLDRVIRTGFRLLGMMTYFTAGVKEVRAWTITQGMKAPQAAGVIHTDFERGFIRAEVIGYDDLVLAGTEKAAREKGLMRLEGKDYVVKDGDICHFRFNV